MKISNDIKAGIWYTVGNFMNRGIAFLSTPVFTRLLSKDDYGEFSNFTAWATLLGVVTSLDLYASISRAYYDFEDDFDTYMSTISWLGIAFCSLCYLIILLFGDWATDMFGMSFRYINMMFLYLVFSPAMQFFMVQQRISGKYKAAIFVNVGSAVFSFVISIVTVLIFNDKVWGRTVGYVLPVVAVNIVIYGLFFSKGRKFLIDQAKYALLISVPMIPHHLSGGILTNSDRFMIKRYCGSSDLAVYSFAYNCALIVSLLSTSVNQAYVPWLYKQLKENNIQVVGRQGKKLLLFFLSIVFGNMLLIPEMVYIFGGEKYKDAVWVIPVIMLGCCFQFLYTYYVNIEIYCKRTITISIGTLCAAGINLALNYVLIPRLGYRIASVTTLVSYILLWFIHYLAAKQLSYKNLYDNKILLFIVFLFSACSMGTMYLYEVSQLLRYCVVAIYIVLMSNMTYKFFMSQK